MTNKFIDEKPEGIKPSLSGQIEELRRKIDNGTGKPEEVAKYVRNLGRLEEQLITDRKKFYDQIKLLVPQSKEDEIYGASQSIPPEYTEEFIGLLSRKSSLNDALENIKNKYNL
jgi:hypothetical protein